MCSLRSTSAMHFASCFQVYFRPGICQRLRHWAGDLCWQYGCRHSGGKWCLRENVFQLFKSKAKEKTRKKDLLRLKNAIAAISSILALRANLRANSLARPNVKGVGRVGLEDWSGRSTVL